MLVYLTSVAAKTLDKLIPLLPRSSRSMKVAFIPTAGDLYDTTPWIEEDREKLLALGFSIDEVDIKDKNPEELKKLFFDKDIIFVAGGNTSYLLEKAQESGFIKIVRDLVSKGKVYVGSSAGSLLASPNIEVDKIYDEEFGRELASYEGLGFVPFVILPHADNPKYAPYLEKVFKEYSNKYELKKLNDNQAIIIIGEKIQTIEV